MSKQMPTQSGSPEQSGQRKLISLKYFAKAAANSLTSPENWEEARSSLRKTFPQCKFDVQGESL